MLATLMAGALVVPEVGAQAAPAAPTPAPPAAPAGTVPLVVSGRAPLSDAQVAVATGGAGEVTSRVGAVGMTVVDVPAAARAAAARALRALPGVTDVDRDRTFRADRIPNDPYWSLQAQSLGSVNVPAAWDVTTGSTAVTVAVVDSGVDAVPDLSGRLLAGYDFVNGDADPSDDDGHGTATALVAAAAGDDGTGVAGLCWTCRVLPVKVLDAEGYGAMSDVVAGIVYAVDRGADVINLSLGGDTTVPAVADAVRYAVDRDVVVVASAGNDGRSDRNYPAAERDVIAVTGLSAGGTLHPSARRGPTWVDLAAPWCNTVVLGSTAFNFCGTSSAAPVVTGAAALLRSRRPGATREMVTNALFTSARYDATAGQVGYGTLDARAALGAVDTVGPGPVVAPRDVTSPTVDVDLPSGFQSGAARVTVRSSDDQRVALARVWVDGQLVAALADPAPTQTLSFDTGPFGDGDHRIDVDVVDGAGHTAAAPSGVLRVDNAAPVAFLVAPRVTPTVTRPFVAAVYVTDPNGIMGTFLIANDQVIGGFRGAGWGQATVPVTRSGPIRVVALTVDVSGRISASNVVAVTARVARARRR